MLNKIKEIWYMRAEENTEDFRLLGIKASAFNLGLGIIMILFGAVNAGLATLQLLVSSLLALGDLITGGVKKTTQKPEAQYFDSFLTK